MSNPEDVARLARSHVKEPRKECFLSVLPGFPEPAGRRRRRVGRVPRHDAGAPAGGFREGNPRRARPRSSWCTTIRPGDPTPSDDDIRLTRRLVEAGKILGIRVHDHVIVAGDRHYSFRSHALV